MIPASEREPHPEAAAIEQEIAQLRRFEALAKSIEVNSKGRKAVHCPRKGLQELKATDLGAPHKAIIFTEVFAQNARISCAASHFGGLFAC